MYILVISDYHTFTSKTSRLLGLLREKSEFFIQLKIQIGLDFHHINNQAPLIQSFNMILEQQKSGTFGWGRPTIWKIYCTDFSIVL